ncbi:MAG: hypothetical protein D6717_11555 [Gammaproteobacteria bacterium]|nr:MAG: hypothetical protein D6717_11555 [Gammaproteobacteria bacterium]
MSFKLFVKNRVKGCRTVNGNSYFITFLSFSSDVNEYLVFFTCFFVYSESSRSERKVKNDILCSVFVIELLNVNEQITLLCFLSPFGCFFIDNSRESNILECNFALGSSRSFYISKNFCIFRVCLGNLSNTLITIGIDTHSDKVCNNFILYFTVFIVFVC